MLIFFSTCVCKISQMTTSAERERGREWSVLVALKNKVPQFHKKYIQNETNFRISAKMSPSFVLHIWFLQTIFFRYWICLHYDTRHTKRAKLQMVLSLLYISFSSANIFVCVCALLYKCLSLKAKLTRARARNELRSCVLADSWIFLLKYQPKRFIWRLKFQMEKDSRCKIATFHPSIHSCVCVWCISARTKDKWK